MGGAGRRSGRGRNVETGHVVVVRDRAGLKGVGGLVASGPYIAGAAAAIVVAYEKANQLGVSDISRAIQSMILVAWGEGVGSNWTGFGRLDGVRKKVGLPDTDEVLAVLPFGYPKRKIGLGKNKRKPLSAVAAAQHYRTPLKQ